MHMKGPRLQDATGTAPGGLSNAAAAIRAYDNDHFLHPWEAMATLGQADRTIAQRADGIYVWDQDGRRLIDGPGGMWCAQIGYGRRDMAEAIAEQVMRLSYPSPWNRSEARRVGKECVSTVTSRWSRHHYKNKHYEH